MRKNYLTVPLLILLTTCSFLLTTGQNTVGVITFNDTLAQPGYNLMYPHNQPDVFLLDNCGRVVHSWTDAANFRPGNSAYITQDGKLYKAKRDASIAGDPIWAGGGGEFLEIRDWDNNLIWEYELEDSTARLHHDFSVMPNGNILAIAWERFDSTQAINAGRNPSLIRDGEIWSEMILEIKPIGLDSFQIVWEWHAWDHLVQDFDMNASNFGVVANSSQLIDINFDDGTGKADWLHFNAIDYNSDLDQIVISCPVFNEIWMVDHSTTTAQASGHSGGLTGRGGDLIYRWGNPLAYDQGDSLDQQLAFQHDVHWIDQTLTPGSDPDYGKLMIFNNRIGPDFSSVEIIEPLFDTYNWAYLMSGQTFQPAAPDWTYTKPTPSDMYSTGLSSAQRLNNGNTLILAGRTGYAFEIDANEQIVWEYKNPLVQGNPATQGDTLVANSNLVFRMLRYPETYAAFNGKDLSTGTHLEINPDTSFCDQLFISVDDPIDTDHMAVYPNPAQNRLTLDLTEQTTAQVEFFNLVGTRVWAGEIAMGKTQVDLAQWKSGLYFIRVDGMPYGKVIVTK